MAKNTLPTNFKDDILNSSMGGKRRYNMIQNSDGTVSLEDASTYDQVGSEYGASQVNAANTAVNASADAGKIVDDIDDIGAITEEGYMAGALALKSVNNSLGGLRFGIDENGNYGYIKAGADSVTPFRSGGLLVFTNYGYGQGSVIKIGNTYYDTTYITSVAVDKADTRTITFEKDCNISLFQSLQCGTTWTQVVVTLNDTEIINKKHTANPTAWYDMLNLSIKSGDIITVRYTYSNVAYVGGETVITFS